LIGGTIGAIGGAISAARQRKDIANTQRDVRRGVDLAGELTSRSVGNIMTSKEYLTGANFIRSMFGVQGNIGEDIQRQVQGEFGNSLRTGGTIVDRDLTAENQKYYGRSGQQVMTENLAAVGGEVPTFGGMDPLSQDFVKNLRASQSSRGLEISMAAGAGEAAGLSSFRFQMQEQMLPQLMALAEAPANLRARYEGGNLQREVYRAGAGAVAYGQANQSLFGSGPSALEGMFQGGAAGFAAGSAAGNGIAATGGLGSLFGGGADFGTPAQPQEPPGYGY
jgi:hypothetical protein